MVEKNDNRNEDSEIGLIVTALIVGFVVTALWTWTYVSLKDETNRGTFGDMFGGINSLFSGLAFAGIILTILLQRKELKLQRDELKDTRAEFKIQNETLKIQRFENTFFNLLNQHHQIVNAIDYRYYKTKEKEKKFTPRSSAEKLREPPEEKEIVVINGRDVFRFRYNKLRNDLKTLPSDYAKIYLAHYGDAQTDFGHYFRNLYRMIKHVDQAIFFDNQSKVSSDEIFKTKYRYTSIIRAQISDYELLWIFYNCLSQNGIEKFKPYIETYSFFKNIPKEHLGDFSHIDLYNNKAYTPAHT